MAKLLASLGAPVHFKDGEILSPLQPKELATCSFFATEPSVISALVTLICACATCAANMP
jgi:hypothetical protein